MSKRWIPGFLIGSVLIAASWVAVGADPEVKPTPVQGPLSPEKSLREFRLAPGLRLELVAADPQIESPVAMAFDEDGKLWVVEMRDYPNGPAPGEPPQGRIKVLEDRDGDRRYETAHIFADGLLFANGLLPWKGGVIVTAAPHILYLKDTDGDGKADQREVLYEGFAALNPQLRVSHPVLGIDNWIYVANGLRGGQVIRSGQKDAEPVNLSGMDFRFDLIHDRAEAISGMGQYGNTFDDWGNRFVCDNRHHLRHVVLEDRYLKRNPYLAVPAVLNDISEIESSVAGSGAPVFPLSKNWTTSNLHTGRFTAACGVMIYRGQLLKDYDGAAFTCDPTGNLVHAEIMRPHGASFRSKPVFDKKEFLATPDDWFRPVSLAHGPDGALYIVDMYRAVIEHPEFMPTELKNRPDLTLGKEKGRIWRLVPEKGEAKGAAPALGNARSSGLVKLLEHPEAWWRTTAQRLLLERQDRSVVENLQELVAQAKVPKARVHAAWLLNELQALSEPLHLKLFKDRDARVRENAVRLAEKSLANSKSLAAAVLDLVEDPDARVRFQVALTLGERDDDANVVALSELALAAVDDPWTRQAVASSIPNRPGALAYILVQDEEGLTKQLTPSRLLLLQELALLIGSRRDRTEVTLFCNSMLELQGKDRLRWQMAGFTGLADGMGRRGTRLGDFLKTMPAIEGFLSQAAKVGGDTKCEAPERLEAIRLLAHAPKDVAEPVLLRLLTDDPVPDVRLAAVRALAAQPGADMAKVLMQSWPVHTPAVRREVIEAMLRQPDRIQFLLGELEGKRITPGDLDAPSTRRLLNHARADIRERAQKLLKDNLPEERKKVLHRYQESLTLKGDALRGRDVFKQQCGNCHLIAGVGLQVGPDISDTRTKTPEMLLLDILNPNAAIDANFVNYQVVTRSGKSATGLIAAETAASITLRRAENQTEVILRQDIEEMRSSGQSLMPEGLEKVINVTQMADLLAFLKNWRYLDGTVPVGVPEKK